MKTVFVILMCVALTSCAATPPVGPDPIEQLAARLNASNGLWINGGYPIIELPPDAKPGEVLAQAVKMIGFDRGHIKTYAIQEVRSVQLNTGRMETYSAALIQSDLGTKILLFKPEKNNHWWTRFYDVSNDKPNQASDATSEPAPGAASSSHQR